MIYFVLFSFVNLQKLIFCSICALIYSLLFRIKVQQTDKRNKQRRKQMQH